MCNPFLTSCYNCWSVIKKMTPKLRFINCYSSYVEMCWDTSIWGAFWPVDQLLTSITKKVIENFCSMANFLTDFLAISKIVVGSWYPHISKKYITVVGRFLLDASCFIFLKILIVVFFCGLFCTLSNAKNSIIKLCLPIDKYERDLFMLELSCYLGCLCKMQHGIHWCLRLKKNILCNLLGRKRGNVS